MRITASKSFSETLGTAKERISAVIKSKLDDFFELSEYDWTPKSREESPSMYLYELVNWLTTVVDSLVIKDTYKGEAYQAAVDYISECLSVSNCQLIRNRAQYEAQGIRFWAKLYRGHQFERPFECER